MAPSTALVWFRRDLRVHDHPALNAAAAAHEQVLGVFVLDPALLEATGRGRSSNRTAFMLACLAELREALRARGSELVIRRGDPVDVLAALAAEAGASTVLWTSDVSPLARRRDTAVTAALRGAGVAARPQSGAYVADPSKPRTAAGEPFAAFTPFERVWERQERRAVLGAPATLGAGRWELEAGELPELADPLPDPVARPGEAAARAALERALAGAVPAYGEDRTLDGGSTVLSPHLRWGTLSARETEERLLALGGTGAARVRRQLAWRDFCAHLTLTDPGSLRRGIKAVGSRVRFDEHPDRLAAWQEGHTGYPLVDAGMRELATRGWMHNRARMVTGSFLVHDLHLHWHAGEEHFARLLYDAEPAQNARNWQWVAGVGADPAPFLRIFNPVTQAREHDPDGAYVRRFVPELAGLPTALLFEPWTAPPAAQEAYGCVVGRDYPAPIVNHAAERADSLARYEAAA